MRVVNLLILSALLFAGCASPTLIPAEDAVRILPKQNERLSERAAEFKAVIDARNGNAFFVDHESISFFANIPDEMASRIAMLGVNNVFMVYDREFFPHSDYQKALMNMIASLHKKEIKVFICLNMSDNLWFRSGNYLWRKLIDPPHNELEVLVRKLVDYQKKQQKNSPASMLDGVIFSFNVESFAASSAQLPPGEIYGWSENAYGIGRDNDIIVKKAFTMFENIKTRLNAENCKMSFGAVAPLFILEKAEAGELSTGRIEDFLKVADFVFFDTRKSASADIAKSIIPILKSSTRDKVGLLLPLSKHAETGVPALRRRSFKQFMTGLGSVIQKCLPYKSFRGIAFDNFSTLEDIWEK